MTEAARIARVPISCDLLVKALDLPMSTEIAGAKIGFDLYGVPCVELIVRHPELEIVPHGAKIPLAIVEFTHTRSRFLKKGE